MGSITSFPWGWAAQRLPPGPGPAPAVRADAITGDGARALGANVDLPEWGSAKAACDTAGACHLARGTTWRAASATGGMRLVSGATNEQDALGAAQRLSPRLVHAKSSYRMCQAKSIAQVSDRQSRRARQDAAQGDL